LWGRPLLPEILGQCDTVGVKTYGQKKRHDMGITRLVKLNFLQSCDIGRDVEKVWICQYERKSILQQKDISDNRATNLM